MYHNNRKPLTMKTKLLPALAALLFFTACQKEYSVTTTKKKQTVSQNGSDQPTPSYGCETLYISMIAGQYIEAGVIDVFNDDKNIYLTFNTANGYVLKETHLYVGDCAAIPVNQKGNPVPGQFPYKNTHDNATTFTYQVPISAIGLQQCGCIAAHASVVKLDASGKVIDAQTAWGKGSLINPNNGNWGMKFNYCTCTAVYGD